MFKYGRLYEKNNEVFFETNASQKRSWGQFKANPLQVLEELSGEGWHVVSSYSNLGGFLLQNHVDWDYVLLKPEDYVGTTFTKEQVAAVRDAAWNMAVHRQEIGYYDSDEIDASDWADAVVGELAKITKIK